MALRANVYMPSPNVKLYMEGNWQKAQNAVGHLQPAIQSGYDKAVNRFSKQLIRIIKMAIMNGGPEGEAWEPLADSTLETYVKKGWNAESPYNRTGLFLRSIGLYHYGKRIYVGLPSNIRTEGGLTMVQLAKLLEFGSRNEEGNFVPARPLFAPSFRAAGGNAKIKKEIIKEIRSNLIHYGFRPNQVKW